MVNLLTIGDPMAKICIDDGRQTVPKNVDAKIAPMDGSVSILNTDNLHEANDHYLQILPQSRLRNDIMVR